MRVSIELFLLDNLLMNLLVLRLGYALEGVRPLFGRMWAAALFGAGMALLSMAYLPVLLTLIPKLALGAVMALPLAETPRAYPKALACLYGAACLMGGVMLALSALFGGGYSNGVLLGTVPLRVALLTCCCCALLPRMVAERLRTLRARALRVSLRLRLGGRTLHLTALMDTGNLLMEPVSGLPVVVVRPGLLPPYAGRPVPYRTVDGDGVLYAIRPDELCVYQGYWHRADAMIAESKRALKSADAIVGAGILTDERWCMHARIETSFGTNLPAASDAAGERPAVCSFGGDAAAAIWPAGGTGVDRTADA